MSEPKMLTKQALRQSWEFCDWRAIKDHIAALEAENNRLRKGMDDVLLTHAAFQSEAGAGMCMCDGCDALRALVEGQQP